MASRNATANAMYDTSARWYGKVKRSCYTPDTFLPNTYILTLDLTVTDNFQSNIERPASYFVQSIIIYGISEKDTKFIPTPGDVLVLWGEVTFFASPGRYRYGVAPVSISNVTQRGYGMTRRTKVETVVNPSGPGQAKTNATTWTYDLVTVVVYRTKDEEEELANKRQAAQIFENARRAMEREAAAADRLAAAKGKR